MFKKSKRWMLLATAICLFMLIPATALAASASASVSASSVSVGKTFTVRVTFKGTNIGAVQASFSYSSSILQYVSGDNASGGGGKGKIVLYASSANASSLSTTLKFKALKAGSTKISVSASEILSYSESSLGAASTSASVKVVSASASPSKTPAPSKSAKPSSSPQASPTPSPSPTIQPIDEAIKVSVDGAELYLWRDISSVELPGGFAASTADYDGKEIQVGQSADKTLTLAYLTDQNGGNGAFYVYDKNAKDFYLYTKINANASYTLLEADSSLTIPEGYMPTQLKIGEKDVGVWKLQSGEEEGFYLVYAMNAKGEKGLYLYDMDEGTMQRFTDRTKIVTVQAPPKSGELPVQQTQPKGFFQQIAESTPLLITFASLGVLCIALGTILIVLAARKKAIGKHEK